MVCPRAQLELDRLIRDIICDCSGYGDSEANPASMSIISVKDRAHELPVQLREADIHPPYHRLPFVW